MCQAPPHRDLIAGRAARLRRAAPRRATDPRATHAAQTVPSLRCQRARIGIPMEHTMATVTRPVVEDRELNIGDRTPSSRRQLASAPLVRWRRGRATTPARTPSASNAGR